MRPRMWMLQGAIDELGAHLWARSNTTWASAIGMASSKSSSLPPLIAAASLATSGARIGS